MKAEVSCRLGMPSAVSHYDVSPVCASLLAALTFVAIEFAGFLSTSRVKGDPDHPTATTELWTFVRDGNSAWRLSAIQRREDAHTRR
jgi:hypothetical protein